MYLAHLESFITYMPGHLSRYLFGTCLVISTEINMAQVHKKYTESHNNIMFIHEVLCYFGIMLNRFFLIIGLLLGLLVLV